MLATKEISEEKLAQSPRIAIIANDQAKYSKVVEYIIQNGFDCQLFDNAKIALQDFGSVDDAIIFISWNLEKTKVKNYVNIFSDNLNFYCVAFAELENTRTSAELVSSGIGHTMQFPYTKKNFLMCINKVVDDRVRDHKKNLRRQEIAEGFKAPEPTGAAMTSATDGSLISETNLAEKKSTPDATTVKTFAGSSNSESLSQNHITANSTDTEKSNVTVYKNESKEETKNLAFSNSATESKAPSLVQEDNSKDTGPNNLHFSSSPDNRPNSSESTPSPHKTTALPARSPMEKNGLKIIPDHEPRKNSTPEDKGEKSTPLFLMEQSEQQKTSFLIKATQDANQTLPTSLERRHGPNFQIDGRRSTDPVSRGLSENQTSSNKPGHHDLDPELNVNAPIKLSPTTSLKANSSPNQNSTEKEDPSPPLKERIRLDLDASEYLSRNQILFLLIGIGIGILIITGYLLEVLIFKFFNS